MNTYVSKNDIYKDYQLAIKLGLHIPPGSYFAIDNYDEFIKALNTDCGAKVEEFSRSVKNFEFEYPLSIGMFVEIPVRGDHGKLLGLRTVMLEHETGPEFFLPLTYAAAVTASAWVGAKIGEKVFDKVLDEAIDTLFGFMKQKWQEVVPSKYLVDHVEIRTAKKGVMRIPFSKFETQQLRCLINRFHEVSHLRECNDCFNGQLVEPPGRSIEWSTESRQRGIVPPLQSCD